MNSKSNTNSQIKCNKARGEPEAYNNRRATSNDGAVKNGNWDNIKELQQYLFQHKGKLIIVAVALISVTLSLLTIGHVFRQLIDQGIGASEMGMINSSILLICALITVFAFGSFCRSYFINLIALEVSSKIKSDSFNNLLNLEAIIFEEMKIGDIISRLSSDIELINGLIINFLSFFVRNSIMLVGAIILMFIQSPKLSIITLLCIPVLLLPILKLSKTVRKLAKQVLEKQGEFASHIEEIFIGIRTIHAYNQQAYQSDNFYQKTIDFNQLAALRLRQRSMFFALAISLISIVLIIVIWIGSIDILNGQMSSGKMISFIYYAMMVGLSAGGIAEMFSELQGPLAALDRVIDLKNKLPEERPKILSKDFTIGDINYRNISFIYPSRPKIEILNNISLQIQQGKFTAIVGKSGSGKSTLLQLLLKFYHYKDGNILIGATEVNTLNAHDLRSKISYIDQTPVIFSGSIRDNILFSNPNASESALQKVIEMCDINTFAKNLPNNIDTEIGQRGVRLSGGQKQRIAIARGLLYNPDILLLDEATSALDSESEGLILQKIRQFMQGKTIISIAHRISSIEKADNILVISQGQLIDQGTHDELINNSKTYHMLYKEQFKKL